MFRRVLTLAVLIVIPEMLFARELTVDLARLQPGKTETRSATADVSWDIVIRNRIPGFGYGVSVDRVPLPIDPLDLAGLRADWTGLCADPVSVFLGQFAGITDEKKVPGIIDEAWRRSAECTDEERAWLSEAIEQHTTRELTLAYTMQLGERLTITIERFASGGNAKKTWTYEASTGPRGAWRVSYGFTFVPNEDELFFAKQSDTDPTKFVVTEQRDEEELDFAPSVMFMWQSSKRQGRSWVPGPIAGLGFDLDNPIVFGGYGFTYNENVTLTFGAVLHKQKRLSGRFEPGQELLESLDSDQLEQETFSLNGYVGIAFRFGSNPFSKQGAKDD